MINKIIIGIDGGLNGAITVLQGGNIIECIVMPTISVGNGKNEYDMHEICKMFRKYLTATVILEKAHAMPKLGTVQAFNFGKGFGAMLGILTALQMKYHIVHAKTWQAIMFRDQPHGDTKASSVIIAQRLFPGYDFRATIKCKKIHDGKTDATLLCAYAQQLNL